MLQLRGIAVQHLFPCGETWAVGETLQDFHIQLGLTETLDKPSPVVPSPNLLLVGFNLTF